MKYIIKSLAILTYSLMTVWHKLIKNTVPEKTDGIEFAKLISDGDWTIPSEREKSCKS